MFKKRCSHCNKKVERSFDFCPYCANPLKDMKKEYGLLGRGDETELTENPADIPTKNQSFMDKLMGTAISSAMKMFEKELKQMDSQEKKLNQNQPLIDPNLQLFINGQRIPLPNQLNSRKGLIENPNMQEDGDLEEGKTKILKKAPKISEETIKKSAKLPRKEARTKLTRLRDRVVYELETPGINSLNNVIVNQLENSIEVKAYTEQAVYIKTLKVKLPLISYSIKENRLFLEFKGN